LPYFFYLGLKNSLKRIILLLTALLVVTASCRKKQPAISADPWAAYRKAFQFITTHKDSAFLHFNRLAESSRDQQQVALAYYNMALLQSDAGDHYGAQESLTLSLKSLDERRQADWTYLSIDFNELGVACYNLQEYTRAIYYYRQALHYVNDKSQVPYILNNRGNAYQKLRDYSRALDSYRQVLRSADKKGTIYARALTNLAITEWLRDPRYNAAPELQRALAVRKGQKDEWGENSSYAHLSDFYARTRPDSALWYARKMSAVARRLKSPDDELEAAQKLILLSRPEQVRSHFLRYQALSDSLSAARKAAKNQFALIRYDVEKSKAANLNLQRDNAVKKYQIIRQYIMLALALLSLTGAILWYRNAMRASQLRTSKKVHDVVANGLYRIMSEVENQPQVDRERLLDKIEVLYERSRDISYEAPRQEYGDFHLKIAELVLAFATDDIKVTVVGNDAAFWAGTGRRLRYEIEHILQELMVNMRKHSGASNVVLKMETARGSGVITYSDDGAGLGEGFEQKNGLRSTGNRIKAIRGRLIFGSDEGKGLQIKISYPIA
jgi:tetratricopeptide (TPR) repeat protein